MYKRLLALALIACWFSVHAQKKESTAGKAMAGTIDYESVGSPMPDLRVVTIDTPAKVYTRKDVISNNNLVVMMFNPLCGHCEDQAEMLEKGISRFRKAKLVMLVSPETGIYLPNFIRAYHLNDHADTIRVGVDSSGFIKKAFLYRALPQVNIYNSERKLIKTYCGGVSIDTLMQYIQ